MIVLLYSLDQSDFIVIINIGILNVVNAQKIF